MSVLFVRISCQKEKKHWPRLRAHKHTQVIVCGDPELKENYKLDGDILYLKCNDTYEALPEKMIAAFNALIRIPQFKMFDRFLKLDFDNGVRNSCKIDQYKDIQLHDYVGQKIYDLTHRENPRDHHFKRVSESSYWHQRKYTGEMVPYADGGCSYVLSRKAMILITNEYGFDSLDKIRKTHIYEDMMVGLMLKKHNITPFKSYYYIAGDKKISTYGRVH